MKAQRILKWLAFSFFILTSTPFLFAQCEFRSPVYIGGNYNRHNLNDLFFIDSLNGWSVGNHGLILHTQNGGQSWDIQYAERNIQFNSVFFLSPDTGWIAGDSGSFHYTFNAGNTWNFIQAPTFANLHGVVFVDPNTGWMVGQQGTLLFTQNGGLTWSLQTSGTNQNLTSITAASAQSLWITGLNGTLLYSHNAGSLWNTAQTNTNRWLFSVDFLFPQKGVAVGTQGTVLATQDSGKTWNIIPTGLFDWFNHVLYLSDSQIVIAGNQGFVTQTTDSGNTWSRVQAGNGNAINAIARLNSQKWVVCGASGLLAISSNSKENWVSLYEGRQNMFRSTFFIDPNHGWIAGESGAMYRTRDGGVNWTPLTPPFGITDQVFFTDTLNGYATVSGGQFRYTRDGGNSWHASATNTTVPFAGIHFVSPQIGWLTGLNGTILHTLDSGITWTPQNSGVMNVMGEVFFVDSLTGWAVGSHGLMLHTQNGGQTWTQQPTGVPNRLMSLYFASHTLGWAVGYEGTLIHTSDGGQTWTQQNSGTHVILNKIAGSDSSFLLIGGNFKTLLHSQNLGNTWHATPSQAIDNIQCVAATAPFKGAAVGNRGELLVLDCFSPSIRVLGNHQPVLNGDTLTQTLNYTLFPNTPAGTKQTRSFIIHNAGSANLSLQTPTLSQISPLSPEGFRIIRPPNNLLRPGTSTLMEIEFNADTAATFYALVSIPNSDTNSPTFSFAIQAQSLPIPKPRIEIWHRNDSIQNILNSHPSKASVHVEEKGSNQIIALIIDVLNTGDTALFLTGNPPVALSTIHNSSFTVVQPATSIIPPDSSVYFEIWVHMDQIPVGKGTHEAEIIIPNSDTAQNPFSFRVLAVNYLSAASHQSHNPISVYPNPASNTLYLKNPYALPITGLQLSNAQGKIVPHLNYNHITGQLNTQDLAAGLYFLTIQSTHNQWVIKVVLE